MLARYAARRVRTSLLADLSLSSASETFSLMGLASAEGVSWRREVVYIELAGDASIGGALSSETDAASPRSEAGMESGKSIL